MTMNKIHGFNLDMLRLCYEAEEPQLLDYFTSFNVGEKIDLYYFYLVRIEGKYYDYVYNICYEEQGQNKLFGELRFGLNKGSAEANTHINGNRKVWLSVHNRVLYSDELYYLGFISDALGLELHNITTLDIALDMSKNIPQYLRRLIKDKSLGVILNGKRIKDRTQDRPEILYIRSGSLDTEKYLTVNIKEKKAINDKSKGRTLTAYNKLAEIANSSAKKYISDKYEQPKKIYRLEVHLNNEEIKDYIKRTCTELNINTVFDINFLYNMYIDTLNHIIRFDYEGKKITWENIIDGVITTTPANIHKKR